MSLPESVTNALGQATAENATQIVSFVGNPWVLACAVALIILAIVVVLFLKHIIVNSVLGIIAWAIIKFVFGINLPFWASLAVSAAFGLAGIGAMLLLRFFGVL